MSCPKKAVRDSMPDLAHPLSVRGGETEVARGAAYFAGSRIACSSLASVAEVSGFWIMLRIPIA